MRIAFVNPPYKVAFSRSSRWPEVTKSGTLYIPIFLCYAAAVAEKAKHEIIVLDSIARKLDFDMTIQTIDTFKPNMVVVESSTPSIKNDVAFVEQYKKDNPTVKVVLVGTHPSALPDETMKMSKFIDFIARHEYDATIIDLANAVGGHKKYSQVDGLVYRDTTGKIVMNKSRELIKNLDEIPFVSEIYNKFLNIEDYRYALAQHPMLQVVSSRGCPNFCTFCLTKTTPVITDHGPVLINDIFERAKYNNDIRHQDLSGVIYNYNKTNVMTHLGEFLPTKYATTNYYSGCIASIKARGMPEIQLTENHKIFVVRREDIANCIHSRNMYCRGYHDNCSACKSKHFLKYRKQVIQAKDIQKGDYLVAPIPKLKQSYQRYIDVMAIFNEFSKNKPKKYSMRDEQMLNKVYELHNQGISTRKIAKFLHMSKSNVHYRIKTRNNMSKIILKTDNKYAWFSGGKTKIPKKIPLDAEMFKLAGYYLAEGCTSQLKNRPNSAYISFTFNKNEKSYISEVSNILFKKFGIRPKLVNNKQNNTIQITVYSNILSLLFERLFGSGCLNKNIHEALLIGNAKLLKQLISGVFRGDGHASKKSVALSTASGKMMSQIVDILFYLGIAPTIVVQDPERRGKAKNTQYLISVWGNDLRKIENITNMYTSHHGNYTETIRTDNEFLLKVVNVKIESYEGQVYNLGVKEAESYTPWFMAVKNCLYPQTLMGRCFRPRSADNFVKELVWIKNNMKVKEIFIEDDTFTVDRQRVLDICRLMKENNMDIPWSCNCRADVPLEVLKAMKEAGCRMVIVGYESGNQAILNTIRKGINIEMAEEFTSNAKEAKLKIFGCFMIGLPGETRETIEETFKFARRLSPDMVFFQQAIPFPGTEFYTWAKLNKYITANDWEEWLDANGQLDCIVSYPNLSNKEICRLKDKLMVRYYASPKHIVHTIIHNFNAGEMKRLGKASTQFLKYLVKRRKK